MSAMDVLREFAEEKGIIAGVCGADSLSVIIDGNAAPFTQGNSKRIWRILPNVESIIVIGAGYNRERRFTPDGAPRGQLSVGAVGLDYHISLRQMLNELEDRLRKEGFVFDSQVFVDTGPISERDMAVAAGLGWRGKHGLIISEDFGSFFNIGCMLISLKIENHEKKTDFALDNRPGARCGECDMCVHACASGALAVKTDETGAKSIVYDYNRCVSYLTQKKGELSGWERSAIDNKLYGCDICQVACPHNQNTYVGKIMTEDYIAPRLDWILTLDKAEYTRNFGTTAIFWRGLRTLKRNAEIAMENFVKPQGTAKVL